MAKIYISSTYIDLKDYREAVYHTLRQMGHDVIAMEDYVATDQRPVDKCLADVAACDLYVGIFAWRYGYQPPHDDNPEQKSITELEYRRARTTGKTCLLFLLNDKAAWLPERMDTHTGAADAGKRIKELRQELSQEKLVSFFESPDELAKLVSVAVGKWEQSQTKPVCQPAEGRNRMMNPENLSHKRVRIIVVNDDAMTFESDVLILKYAQAHYGLDRDVSYKLSRLGVSPELMSPEVESYNLINSRGGLGARNVLIFGVVNLYDFGYEEIRKFAKSSLKALSGNGGNFRHISITLHGVGSGLDEMETFYSEVAGLIDGIISGEAPTEVEQISIIDHNERRVERLSEALSRLLPRGFIEIDFGNYLKKIEKEVTEKYRSAGYLSATKPHIFVAMPFREDMEDIYDYGISGAVRSAGFLCERADLSSFTGDVMDWVKKRIQNASLLIADLTTANPNVYLEVGFAWGSNVPTVLLVQDVNDLKFDVKNQRCIVYKRIKELEEKLQKELSNLSVQVGLSGGN